MMVGTLIAGLRFHILNRRVHIHDDTKNLQFFLDQRKFRTEVEHAFEILLKEEGAVKVSGETSVSLYLIRDGNKYITFISDMSSIKGKIDKFINGC